MQHDHLKFYSHGGGSNNNNRITTLKLGTGSEIIPTLFNPNISINPSASQSHHRSDIEKHIDIVEYLRQLPIAAKVDI